MEFSVARLPRIEFGCGILRKLPEIIKSIGGTSVLFVTGANSFMNSTNWQQLRRGLAEKSIQWQQCSVSQEPSPQLVDDTVRQYKNHKFDVVVGIGGGSALDAGKAIAGLLKGQASVMDYLEGVGPELAYLGPAIPFIAVPTTAGTGSEATKNSVLSVPGMDGFKKSFRDDKLVAEFAIVDPDLLQSCPADVIAANGMDALTQLIESYVSLKSNIFTDALALRAIGAVRDALLPLYCQQGDLQRSRENMAYAALVSGITLAQVGLGSVHGLASPLGAFYPIPHGVVCGTLLATATEMNIQAMLSRQPTNTALTKYVRVAEIMCQKHYKNDDAAWQELPDLLDNWTNTLNIPRLSEYGVDEGALNHIVTHSRGSSMKTNPIRLNDNEIKHIIVARL